MGGEEVPESWRGAINTTYRIGGPLQNSGWWVARHYSYETYSWCYRIFVSCYSNLDVRRVIKKFVDRLHNEIETLKGRPIKYCIFLKHHNFSLNNKLAYILIIFE